MDESDFVVPNRAIPDEWPRAYGMDVGWNRTAVIALNAWNGPAIKQAKVEMALSTEACQECHREWAEHSFNHPAQSKRPALS